MDNSSISQVKTTQPTSMKQSLEKRIIIFSFVILSLTILANTGMDIAVFRKDFIQEILLRSQSLGAALKSNIEKVLALGLEIRDVSGLPDKCLEVVQSDPEIAYCVICGSDGIPLFANDKFYTALNFSGNDDIHTEEATKLLKTVTIKTSKGVYYDTVTPVRSFDGKTVATIHLGFPQATINQKVHAIILRSIIVFVVFFTISFTLVVFFVKRNIMTPISTILEGLTRISQGNFKTPIMELAVYELNELGGNINAMSIALDTRDAELRRNYGELSATHTQLHDSFVRLETVSNNLEKSEELYKKMLEESNDAIIILDHNETIIIANKMAEFFLGYPASMIVGQHISNILLLLKTENIARMLKIFQEAHSGIQISEEFIITNGDNKSLVGRIHASCIAMDSDYLLQVIIRDITKEQEILTNLEKSAAGLARLNKMKDSFLGLASHELKTPLTVIMGYSELLLTDMKDQLTKTTGEMIQNISGAASRLDSIVKDMIDVSMIDHKQLDLKINSIDINKLIETAINEMQFFFSLRKQDIVTNLTTSLPPINGDKNRLMQLISNVIGNAVKFTPDGGKIIISTAARQVTRNRHLSDVDDLCTLSIGKGSNSYIEIIITDTGIGIDKEDQIHIFDKFYEAGNIEEHSSGKVAFKSRGAGLGLSVAKGVVEMHGGEIWVESPGHDPQNCPGASFFILLPIDPLLSENSIDYRILS